MPELLDHLREHGRSYDLVLFWTFRYYPSFFGVPLVRDRAVLVPTAEDDPAIRSRCRSQEFFSAPGGYLFLTPEEKALVSARAGRPLQSIGGDRHRARAGRPDCRPATLLRAHGIPDDYILYLGRVDRNKGCDTLLEYFQEYASASDADAARAGRTGQDADPGASDAFARSATCPTISAARCSLTRACSSCPSPYESLSIVLLEAWNHGVPALVNARCKVLHGQVRRANGGLYYRTFNEFREALDYLRAPRRGTRARSARRGLRSSSASTAGRPSSPRVEDLLARTLRRRGHAAASPAV